jgi:hypothetical protein
MTNSARRKYLSKKAIDDPYLLLINGFFHALPAPPLAKSWAEQCGKAESLTADRHSRW